MAGFIKTPFTNTYFKGGQTGSDYEGNKTAGGDIEIKGQDVVVMGPDISGEPSDLADILSSLTSRAK